MTELLSIHDALAQQAAVDATRRAGNLQRQRSQMSPQWYLVHTGPGDTKAVEHLKRANFEVYYPQMRLHKPVPQRLISSKNRQRGFTPIRTVIEPVWKRYMFVLMDLRDPMWRPAFEFAGVHGMIAVEDNLLPAPVPDQKIAELRDLEVDGAMPGETPVRKLKFAVGDKVRIEDGPFEGYNGTVENVPEVTIADLDINVRIRVAVEMFGRVTPVELPLTAIVLR